MLTLQVPRLSFASSLSPNSSRSRSPSPSPASSYANRNTREVKHHLREAHETCTRPRFITPPLASATSPATGPPPHPSRTHFTYTTKYHHQILPKLAGPSNYSPWAANLARILTAQDLWSFVDPASASARSPAAFPSPDAGGEAARAYARRRRRALMVVVLSCVWPVQRRLAGCTDPSVAWLILADYCEWAPRDPEVGEEVGKHRFEYAFEGCKWEVWWLEGSANWDEWRLSLKVVLDAEGFGPANPTGAYSERKADDRGRRDAVSLAIVNICIEDGLRALVKKRGCRSAEEAIATLERLCGRKRSQSNAGLIDLQPSLQ